MKLLKRFLYFVGLPALLIVLWWATSRNGTSFFVPKPGPLVHAFRTVWLGDGFHKDVVPSLTRLAAGLIISIALGIGLGVVIGSVDWVRWLLGPLLEFLRAVPSTILIPVLLLVIGINDAMKVTVIVLGCIWPVLLNTVKGVASIDEVQLSTGEVYGLRGLDRLRYLVLPAASPQIFAGIRQSLAVGLVLMVTSEMFAATEGIGYATINFQNQVAIPEMWSGIVLLGLIGVALSVLFQLVQRRVLGWYEGLKESANV
ncbi:ABC transporter permease [Nocardioides nematodiphilus]|uniref:ABC transporter permease n=1 Tax=Nocardioides nematodiphilus TaxID=2849669 RepID=UPI001CDA2EB7|nr:ABC transporter permease [Nocardioides nematodiphilus]MCA1983080.1 ABC transporter permease [Nocardioides nematodiphilus]